MAPEIITSYEARRGQLHNLGTEELRNETLRLGIEQPEMTNERGFVTTRAQVIQMILDAEYPSTKSCHCGDTTKLYTVHVPVEDGDGCFLYPGEAGHVNDTKAVELRALGGRTWPLPETESGRHILEQIVPEVLEKFLAKNADYGDQHRDGLGPRAEYVGIHRKVYKLKSALWEGREMNSEGAREMLTDLIGQCLIVLDLLDQEA